MAEHWPSDPDIWANKPKIWPRVGSSPPDAHEATPNLLRTAPEDWQTASRRARRVRRSPQRPELGGSERLESRNDDAKTRDRVWRMRHRSSTPKLCEAVAGQRSGDTFSRRSCQALAEQPTGRAGLSQGSRLHTGRSQTAHQILGRRPLCALTLLQ